MVGRVRRAADVDDLVLAHDQPKWEHIEHLTKPTIPSNTGVQMLIDGA